jgi:Lipopolysaccharide kinase (Kdo/WaaP) family
MHLEVIQKVVKGQAPNFPKPIKYIGGGANGRVFETNDGRYIKIVARNAPQEWKSLLRLQGTRIVPRFHKNNHKLVSLPTRTHRELAAKMLDIPPRSMGSHLTMFVMGKVGGGHAMTLVNYTKKFPGRENVHKIQNRIFHLIGEMHVRGISHGNLHGGNILVTANASGNITGMWVIDFGRSTKIPHGKTEREHYTSRGSTGNSAIRSLFFRGKSPVNIPVFNGSRANVHMANIHYNKKFIRPRENKIKILRNFVRTEMKNLKSPKKVRSVRKTRSAEKYSPKKSVSRSAH